MLETYLSRMQILKLSVHKLGNLIIAFVSLYIRVTNLMQLVCYLFAETTHKQTKP